MQDKVFGRRLEQSMHMYTPRAVRETSPLKSGMPLWSSKVEWLAETEDAKYECPTQKVLSWSRT